jgi:hypothetical protein
VSNIAYANFLITGPEGYAANAETEQEALDILANAFDWFAERLEVQPSMAIVVKEMRSQAKRVRAVNAVTASWPRSYRFAGPAFEFFDFTAERNRPREES